MVIANTARGTSSMTKSIEELLVRCYVSKVWSRFLNVMLAQGAWNYYTFSAFTQNDVDIILSSLDSGDCQVMVNNDARPSM